MAEEFGTFPKQEVKPIDINAIPEEDKVSFLKRIALEKKEAKKNAKALESWFVVNGNKLLKKTLKASGGIYTQYIANIKKNKAILDAYKNQVKSLDYKPDFASLSAAKVEAAAPVAKRGRK